MALVAILRETVRALDQADDLRKYSPVVAQLKQQVLRVIAELEAEKRAPQSNPSPPIPANGNGTGAGRP